MLVFDSHYICIFSFFKKALWKLTNVKNMPLRGNGPHYLLPVHMETPSGPKSTEDLA